MHVLPAINPRSRDIRRQTNMSTAVPAFTIGTVALLQSGGFSAVEAVTCAASSGITCSNSFSPIEPAPTHFDCASDPCTSQECCEIGERCVGLRALPCHNFCLRVSCLRCTAHCIALNDYISHRKGRTRGVHDEVYIVTVSESGNTRQNNYAAQWPKTGTLIFQNISLPGRMQPFSIYI